MKTILGSRKPRSLVRLGLFLIMAALLAAMAGCPGGYNPPPSQNLEIRTWYDLNEVRDNLAGNHTLMNDLNSTTPGYEELASPTANGGKGWEPIGFIDLRYGYAGPGPFGGTFDGQGYDICDLHINRPDESYVGLFGVVYQDGVLKNIGVVNVTVSGNHSVGGLLGSNAATVSNCYSSGEVSGDEYIGGLVGLIIANGVVSYSYSTSNVTGKLQVGGLAGRDTGTVSNSYSTGSVTGMGDVGGLVGYAYGNPVSDSYSIGNVSGYEHTGGLVGWNEGDTTVVSNCFWDTQTSGQATSAGGTGKNTTEMQDIITFSDAIWDIITVALNETNPAYIWNIVDDVTYPFLNWQPV